jgi:hypothetical protein
MILKRIRNYHASNNNSTHSSRIEEEEGIDVGGKKEGTSKETEDSSEAKEKETLNRETTERIEGTPSSTQTIGYRWQYRNNP